MSNYSIHDTLGSSLFAHTIGFRLKKEVIAEMSGQTVHAKRRREFLNAALHLSAIRRYHDTELVNFLKNEHSDEAVDVSIIGPLNHPGLQRL